MLQDLSIVDAKHTRFIERVVEFETVWGLQNEEGWAVSGSNELEDVDVFPFWSDKAYATVCAKENWKSYVATSMPLAEFLESWCVGMHNNNILAGTNWDANMFGKEVDPLALALKILKKLKENNKPIVFAIYTNSDEFETLLRATINDNL